MFFRGSLLHGNDIQIEHVRAIDPLGADEVCGRLPEMNRRADVTSLVGSLRDLLPDARGLANLDMDDCLAAMRDVGLFLGSIKRHGHEPVGLVPEVGPLLVELGNRTDLVPRDIVHHYCTWNPLGERQRMYTGDAQENHLQNAVRIVFPHLRAALEMCHILRDVEPADPKFAVLADALDRELQPMVEAIKLVGEHVSPQFFARTLRPYFEDVEVDGRKYLGPAAAQVPLWLVDEAVWASDRGERNYLDFLDHSVPYSLPRWRELHTAWVGTSSLVTAVIDAYGNDHSIADRAAPTLVSSARALARVLRTMLVFRGRHLTIARQAYQEDLRLYPVGSGGASVDLLREIIVLTRQNSQVTKEMSGPDTRARAAGAAT